MSHVFLLVSSGAGAGLTTISLGMVRALDQLGIRTGFYKPVAQFHDGDLGPERSTQLIKSMTNIVPPTPINLSRVKSMLGANQEALLMEEVIQLYHQSAAHADVVIVEGLVADGHAGYATRINTAIAKALDAEVLLVAKPENDLEKYIDMAAHTFSDANRTSLMGIIINQVGHHDPEETAATIPSNIEPKSTPVSMMRKRLANQSYHLLACIPWEPSLMAPRTCDIAQYLQAEVLYAGEMNQRRVQNIELCARTLVNTLSVYQAHTLLIFPGDRDDVFVAACMAAMNGIPLAGILLTGTIKPSPAVMDLCFQAIQTGLPILMVPQNSFYTAAKVASMPHEIAIDDLDLVDQAMHHVTNQIDSDWLQARCNLERKPRLSPAAFRYQLIQQAIQAHQRIILPEGDEPRTVMAAHQCQQRKIAQCILLGQPDKIHQIATSQGFQLDANITIIDPDHIRQRYIEPMVKLRQHRGLTPQMAEDQLQDRVVLATMMLALGEVDGLVSGTIHTTANTVRPALQLIGTHKKAKLVSSIFFMCLPDEVVVYGDCAINPEPNEEQLADIAIQSSDSAKQFGLQPKVAMISYSTGESGAGDNVQKVLQATKRVHQSRPDILVDGPLQYDAASIVTVGKSKAPNSQVAGKANVFIFPDLNTGNTTYKAVQRSAHVVSIGPMLQGLNKPVNDLSRGALLEDIVYTIALTCIQASSN